MNAFEALAKLDSSNVVAIRGNLYRRGYSTTDTTVKSEVAEYGINIAPKFFANNAHWEVAYVCENCSGNGMMEKIEYHKVYRKLIHSITNEVCPECDGDKMIWSDK